MAEMGTLTRTKRAGVVALGAWLLGLCVGLAAPAAAATHYPAGASCYDCHAVSESKMVVGTRLIKKSQKTIDLDITGSSSPIKCLFCHEKNAVSVQNRTEMRGVWDHFDSSSLSKHLVQDATATPQSKTYSTFAPDGARFDCLDCHVGLNTGVVSDGAGNARVHGIDASTQNVNLYTSLIGAPTNADQLATTTCQNAACHDADGATVGGYNAPKGHPYGKTTLNDGAAPAGCLSCHGMHNSYQNASLVILRKDGTTSNNPTDPSSTAVTPDQCGECHSQDDDTDAVTAGKQDDWSLRGHGMATGYGGDRVALNCVSCHDSAKPHKWDGSDKRFSLPEVTGASGMTTGKSMLSVCTTCHAGFTAHKAKAGCLDCHDPHGQNLGVTGDYNIMMVRRKVPLTSGNALDTTVFKVSGVHDTAVTYDYWRAGDTAGYNGSSRGVCDNADCHSGVQSWNNRNIWSLGSYFGSYGSEHGLGMAGNQTAGGNCQGCHKHSLTEPGAGFGGAAACDDCHGYPPTSGDAFVDNPDAVGAHQVHVSIYGTSNCNLCHYNNQHNESNWSKNSGTPIPTANVDVAFNPSLNPTVGSYTPNYNAGTNTCSNLRCHNPDSGPVGVGVGITGKSNAATTNAPVWTTAVAEITTCTGCHATSPASNPDGGSHYKHDSASGKAYSCRVCHAGENAAANTYSGTHARGTLDTGSSLVSLDLTLAGLPAGGTYVDGSSGVTGGTCQTLYCHGATLTTGGGSHIAAPNWPTWGTAATGQCGSCHDGNGTGDGSVVVSGNHTDHLTSAYGPNFTNTGCTGTATTGCHTDSQLSSATHVDGTLGLANINTTLATASALGLTAPAGAPDATSTDRCNRCHSTANVGGIGVGTVLAKTNWATTGYSLACLSCHDAAQPATRYADGTGVAAPAKDTYFATTGHGRPAVSGGYAVTGNQAANFTEARCTVCHNEGSAHLSGVLNDSDRLKAVTESPALAYTGAVSEVCLDCHKVGQSAAGTLGRDALNEATVHSGAITGKYNTAALAANAFPAYGNAANYAASPGYQCEACHDAHGTQRLAMVLDTLDGNLGGTSNPKNLAAGVFVTGDADMRDLDPTSAADDGVCDACHKSTGTITAHPDTAHAGNHNQGGTGTSCVGCHDHKKSFQGSCTSCHGNTATGNWWPDGLTSEHAAGYPNRAGDHQQHIDAIALVRYGASPTVAQKNSTCDTCHPNPGAARGGTTGEAVHNDNVAPADLYGDGRTGAPAATFKTISGAVQAVQGTYDNTAVANGKDCSNVDCHYRVTTPTTGTVTANGDGWYQPLAAATCSNCHGNGLAGAALPNSHPDHVNSGAKAYGCWNCHPSGVNNASYTTSHQTGQVNWSFASTLDPAVGGPRAELYSGLATGTTAVKFGTGTFGTCQATYCHGNFTGGTGANAPTWGTALSGQCGTCHNGNGTGNLTVINDANHTDHLTSASGPTFGAAGCTGTATTGCHTDSTLATATHVDGKKDFANLNTSVTAVSALGTTAPAGAPDATSTDRCNRCHSTAVASGQAQSGTVLAKTNWTNAGYLLPCVTCHDAAQPATRYPDGTGVAAPAKDTFWATTGHGRPTGSNYAVTGNPPANFTEARCTVCHDDAAAHISGTLGDANRFKAVTESPALTYTDANSEVCLDCHKVGQSANGNLGKDAVNEASVHSGGVNNKYNTAASAASAFPAYGDSANYAANPGYQCRACHEPHGTQRLAMVLDTIDGRLGGTSNPKNLAAGVFVTADADMRDLDPTAAADDGVCDACHRASGNTAPHPDTSHAGNHNQGGTGTSCMACHDHKKSFQGTCTSCHGNTAAGNWWPDSTAEHGTAYPNRLGDHQKHIDAIAARMGWSTVAQKNASCDWCHPNPGAARTGTGEATHYEATWTAPADVHGDGRSGAAASTFKTILGATQAVQGTYDAGTGANGKDCSNTDCHYRAVTPTTGSPTSNGDGWYAVSTATCESCHYYRDGAGYPAARAWAAGALPDAHQAHVAGIAPPANNQSKAYLCSYCHTTAGYTTSHENGAIDLSDAGSPNQAFDGNASDEAITPGSLTVKYGVGTANTTCTNFYCHGADFAVGTQGTDVSPTWNSHLTGACGTCHDVATSVGGPITQGKHQTHLSGNAWGPGYPAAHGGECTYCHGMKSFPGGINNCNSQVCHPAGGTDSPGGASDAGWASFPSPSHVEGGATVDFEGLNRGWNWFDDHLSNVPNGTVGTLAGTDICNRCHSTANVGGQVGATLAKGNWAAAGYRLSCESCHNNTSPAYSWPVSGGLPAPGKTAYAGHGGVAPAQSCQACHDENGAHINTVAGDEDRIVQADVTTFCQYCHDGAVDDNVAAQSVVEVAATKASVHSNTSAGYTPPIPPKETLFTQGCKDCHDPHGTSNLTMVLPTITTPNSGVQAVTFTSRTQFDTAAGSQDICQVCHTQTEHNGGLGGRHTQSYLDTNTCTGCHPHEFDGNVATPDGFMPLQCDACHAYPPASNAHTAHVAAPAAGYGFACVKCHSGNNHNELAVVNAAGYTALNAVTLANAIDVNFDATNPTGSYSPAKGSRVAGGAGTCNSLYCHGATLGAAGSDTTPQWNVASTGDCGTCHDTGTNDSTVGTSIATGNHTDHLTAAYGPAFGATQPAACTNCHPAYAMGAATHVNGVKDFDNVAATPATSPLGTLAVTTPTATDTDRCTHCHSTTNVAGVGVGTVLAKTNWGSGAYTLDCLTCHNAADPANNLADGTGLAPAPAKDAYWKTGTNPGHGLTSVSTYPWGSNRSGANLVCTDCHNAAAGHINPAATEDRLLTAGNDLCNNCHDGTGTGNKAQTRVSTHANTSTTMAARYTRQRAQFELNCSECHDVHGSTNIFMIGAANTNGPLVAPRLYNGAANTATFLYQGTVDFRFDTPAASTTAGTGYVNPNTGAGSYASKICQTCHTVTVHFEFDSNDGHLNTDCIVCHKHDFDTTYTATSQDGFMPAGCSGCHGYPPVRPGEEGGNPDYLAENYAGGGGFHKAHVEALQSKLSASVDTREICGPCHGDGAGSANHADSGFSSGAWTTAGRDQINIRAKAAGQSSWGAGTYGGNAVDATGTTPPNAAMNQANSTCATLDCHGNPTAGEGLYWNMTLTDGAGTSDGLSKSQTCKGCHDQTPSAWRVYNAAGTLTYTGSAPNAAANYYATLSGYGRGGHGDAGILGEIPAPGTGGRPDATGTPPLDCTACHSDAAAHFPEAAGNLHRLTTTTIENTSGTGLCNSCHARTYYPGEHHPSLQGTAANPTKDIVPAAGQEIFTVPSSWILVGGEYEQNGYSAQNVSGNPDPYVNWWGSTPGNGNQDPPPQPVPFTVLPLLQYIGNQSGTNNVVMCVTCHNPHGTDMFVYDPAGTHQSIMDNNMLRAPDSTNVLCNACH